MPTNGPPRKHESSQAAERPRLAQFAPLPWMAVQCFPLAQRPISLAPCLPPLCPCPNPSHPAKRPRVLAAQSRPRSLPAAGHAAWRPRLHRHEGRAARRVPRQRSRPPAAWDLSPPCLPCPRHRWPRPHPPLVPWPRWPSPAEPPPCPTGPTLAPAAPHQSPSALLPRWTTTETPVGSLAAFSSRRERSHCGLAGSPSARCLMFAARPEPWQRHCPASAGRH